MESEPSPCFRVHENAAPLKRLPSLCSPYQDNGFRVHENAAPLKHELNGYTCWTTRAVSAFIENAAPLKHESVVGDPTRRFCFRVHENAAPLKPASVVGQWLEWESFRVHENAAPLKPATT